VTFADILQNLRHYDNEPADTNAPSIYVAEPWARLPKLWLGGQGKKVAFR
jgi:hypothetical protein